MKKMIIVVAVAILFTACDATEFMNAIEQDVACCQGDEEACQAIIESGRDLPECKEGE